MMKFLYSLLLLILAIPLAAFDFAQWKAINLDTSKYENGILHLTKSGRAKNNGYLYRKVGKNSIKQFAGKRVTLSADVELLAASHTDTVGVSIVCKLNNGRSIDSRAALPFRGKRSATKIFTSLDVPENAAALTFQIEAPRGWYRTADTLWRNIELKTSEP